ncbi:MAG: DoxX family protein [Candidatus Sungbacteria bacterium]|nr:DoxX family protein [Candidatus Sungbacteria bacterium]
MFYSLLVYGDFAALILRLVLGLAFIVHGYPKLFNREARTGTAGWFDSIGIRPGKFWIIVSGVAEFFGGIAVLLGFYTQIAAVFIAISMLVAMWKAKWGKVGFTVQGGWELDLAYFAMAAALIFLGAGAWGIDTYFFL